MFICAKEKQNKTEKNNVVLSGLSQIKSLSTFIVFNRSPKIKCRHPSSWLQNFLWRSILLAFCQEKNSPVAGHCRGDEGLPSSEARKTKADEKMDKISPEGRRGLVEFKLLKAALNRLPTWPWASISSVPLWVRFTIMVAPRGSPWGLDSGSQMVAYSWEVSIHQGQSREQGHSTIWERARGWVPSVNQPFLGRTAS